MEKGLVFGLSIGELLTIYDPDSQSWKMSECLFTGDFARYSEALPKSGMMRNGRIYEQATWVRRTGGRESGLWPTPAAMDSETHSLPRESRLVVTKNQTVRLKNPDGSQSNLGLSRCVKMWPTPRSCDGDNGTRTPEGHAAERERRKNGVDLPTAVMFPTPQARDWKGKSQRANYQEENRDCLPNVIGGQLNPTWVEWLMGYPLGWTDCADSEMRLSLK